MRKLLIAILLINILTPLSSAAINSDSGGGELWFSCDNPDSCMLTEFHVGDESISQSVNSATPISPEYFLIELPMMPSQNEIALLPDIIDELQVDLRFTDDLLGISKPDLKVTIIVAESVTTIEFEGTENFGQTNNGPYNIQNEPLNNGGDRLLWPDEEIKILLEFQIDRPGTWELKLRGSSYLFLDIIWSEDIESRNTDEPSSDSNPVQTELDVYHYGALVSDDRDCWSFDVENHEILRISFVWEVVPSEIEQNHGRPDLILPDRRMAPTPEMETISTNDETRITWQWRALPIGEYDLCIGGKLDSFQPYSWIGLIAFEAIGITSPDQFTYTSSEWEGYGMKATEFGAEELNSSPIFVYVIISLAVLIGLSIQIKVETISSTIKYGVFTPGVLILILTGIVSPMVTTASEFQSSDEQNLSELLESRLEQIWHASHPATPASSKSMHVGSTFGMLDGETLSLYLKSDSAWPLDDGRWQLHIPELYEINIENLIFDKVVDKVGVNPSSDLLDSHSSNFVLLAARTLILDLLMLEAMMVVDELPNSNVIHFETTMVKSASSGTVQNPAWSTRPSDIPEGRWRLMQDNLYPSMISIIMLDGEKDDLEFNIQLGYNVDHELLYSPSSVNPVDSFIPFQLVWFLCGLFLIAAGVFYENNRRKGAIKILNEMMPSQKWID